MQTIHVLSIGNSFSQDAHQYLHDLAKSQGVAMETVNLYIGGCSLEQHFRNMAADRRAYDLEINGHRAEGFFVSIREALTARAWDVITLQQASRFSFVAETYFPYLEELAEYVRDMCPCARVMMHQTWGYETGSQMIRELGFENYEDMFARVRACYQAAAVRIGADGIIPSGAAFQYALDRGIPSVHRDTFHAKFGVGCFILALVWYGCLTGRDVRTVNFGAFDETIREDEYRIALEAAYQALTHRN